MRPPFERVNDAVAALPRSLKRTLMVAVDMVTLPVALWLALALKAGSPAPRSVGSGRCSCCCRCSPFQYSATSACTGRWCAI
ncbi:MAG: hypothetical protein U5L11_08005 [Arhodomonas sp.]|nr:hypothetical protein [Arhodomonas sp.]